MEEYLYADVCPIVCSIFLSNCAVKSSAQGFMLSVEAFFSSFYLQLFF